MRKSAVDNLEQVSSMEVQASRLRINMDALKNAGSADRVIIDDEIVQTDSPKWEMGETVLNKCFREESNVLDAGKSVIL